MNSTAVPLHPIARGHAGLLAMPSSPSGDALRLTEWIKKRRADFWAALCDDGNWRVSDTADFFFDKFVPAGLSLENLGAEKKNAIGTMLTAVRRISANCHGSSRRSGATWILFNRHVPDRRSILTPGREE
jgi:hypothetical protein